MIIENMSQLELNPHATWQSATNTSNPFFLLHFNTCRKDLPSFFLPTVHQNSIKKEKLKDK